MKLVQNYKAFNVQIFTSSDVFTVPSEAKYIEVFAVGGGGNGGQGRYTDGFSSINTKGSGGGGGYTITTKLSESKINISIGSSASNTIVNKNTAKAGSNGNQVYYTNGTPGGDGGSGGGASYPGGNNAGDGGSDGSNGVNKYSGTDPGHTDLSGKGQGTTTRAFGEPGGTLYAGGGGGATGARDIGLGGAGGGGNGESYAYNENGGWPIGASSGAANTGGGGGGSNISDHPWYKGNGGSGIAIVRWR